MTIFSAPAKAISLITLLTLSVSACSGDTPTNESTMQSAEETVETKIKVAIYEYDARRGRTLFVSRGCVMCHSVNGVGGRAAYALDKETFLTEIDPIAFAARMWRGAPQMLKLQEMEMGYQINVGAQDLADLAAFAGDPEEQRKLTLDQVPQAMQDTFLNEFLWTDEEYGADPEME